MYNNESINSDKTILSSSEQKTDHCVYYVIV